MPPKAAKAVKAQKSAGGEGSKKRRSRRVETFSSYIYKVLKQVRCKCPSLLHFVVFLFFCCFLFSVSLGLSLFLSVLPVSLLFEQALLPLLLSMRFL